VSGSIAIGTKFTVPPVAVGPQFRPVKINDQR